MRYFILQILLLLIVGCGGSPAIFPVKDTYISPISNISNATKSTFSFNIRANEGWTNSGIKLKKDDKVIIEAEGMWSGLVHFPNFVGPEGQGETIRGVREVAGISFASLIGRIGEGYPFYVGSEKRFKAINDGPLLFCINKNKQGRKLLKGYMSIKVDVYSKQGTILDKRDQAVQDSQAKNKIKKSKKNRLNVSLSSWRAPTQTRLLSVGISNFKDDSIPQVNYAAKDAKYISSFLNSSGIPQENLTCLTNQNASRSDIIDALMNLKMATTESSETAIFYFSGHGAPILKDGEIVDAALVPYDASQEGIEYTGIRISRLKEILSDTQGNWIVILDACFSGKEGRSLMAKDVKSIAVVPNDYNVGPENSNKSYWLTSTSGDNFANSFKKKDHGLFTYYFVQALNGKKGVDTNQDGLITVEEAFSWTKDKVTSISKKSLGKPQYPEISGKGELILTVPQ